MKTLMKGLLKGRMARRGLLAAVVAVSGLCMASMSQKQYQLGGGFIGADPGGMWSAVQTPLDPDGRTAAVVVKTLDDNGAYAGLITAFGGNTVSDAVGEQQMISRDTAKWYTVAYAQLAGVTPKITAIFVLTGTLQFTGPDNFVINYTFNVYLPADDANHDGFPDAGATPALTLPGLTSAAKRVPIL